jgi:uncharacterized membrane protein
MKPFKSSAALKADAREQLLGKYKTVILAYMLMEVFITGCLTLVQSQVNMQRTTGRIMYYAVYLIVLLLSSVFIAGQHYLYLNIARGRTYAVSDLWYAFRTCADRAIKVNMQLLLLGAACGLPLVLSVYVMLDTQNYYLSLLVAVCLILFFAGLTMILLFYTQALYLLLDYPEESSRQLLAHSRMLMKGHKGSYFYLLVSFSGILLLALLTFGIGMFWIYPYMTATQTNFYLQLIETESEDETASI